MKSGILPSTGCSNVLLAAVFATVAGSASGAPVTFAGMSMETNGSAALVGPTLRLTPATNDQAGSAFTVNPFAITDSTNFSTAFQFRIHGGTEAFGADGLTFTVQNSLAGADALGLNGNNLGYGGISPSVAVEFDTFAIPQVGIDQNGSLSSSTQVNVANLRNTSLFAWVDYDGSTDLMEVFFSTNSVKPATPLLSHTFDLASLGSQAFFGFTAGTGGLNDNHDIEAWTLSVTAPASSVPEPGTLPMLLLAFASIAALLWRQSTPSCENQVVAWSPRRN